MRFECCASYYLFEAAAVCNYRPLQQTWLLTYSRLHPRKPGVSARFLSSLLGYCLHECFCVCACTCTLGSVLTEFSLLQEVCRERLSISSLGKKKKKKDGIFRGFMEQ